MSLQPDLWLPLLGDMTLMSPAGSPCPGQAPAWVAATWLAWLPASLSARPAASPCLPEGLLPGAAARGHYQPAAVPVPQPEVQS